MNNAETEKTFNHSKASIADKIALVAELEHGRRHAPAAERAQHAGVFAADGVRPDPRGPFPHGKGGKEGGRQKHLQPTHRPVAAAPVHAPGQTGRHHIGPHRGAQTPEAVQPAHVPGVVVEGDKVIERRIHAARAQTVGQRQQAQRPKPWRHRKTEEGRGGQRNAQRRYPPRTQPPGQRVAGRRGAPPQAESPSTRIAARSSASIFFIWLPP